MFVQKWMLRLTVAEEWSDQTGRRKVDAELADQIRRRRRRSIAVAV